MVRLRIRHDDQAENPRKDSQRGQMAIWHRRYTLGDVQPKEDPREWFKARPKGSVTLPLYLYDHGNISLQCGTFSCTFDSGQVGYITMPPDVIRYEYSVKRITAKLRATVAKHLEQEVVYYNHWLEGSCWGFEFEGYGDDDSCWGFIGDDLEYTGLTSHIPEQFHDLLRKAWDARFEGTWCMAPSWVSFESSHG